MKREGIFISYARTDGAPTAAELRQLLTEKGFVVWQDRVNIEGGREWWLQITEALDQVAFMLLVVTPGSAASTVVRKEWRYARQQGVCVYLVKGTADLDFGKLPRWMSEQHIYDFFKDHDRAKLIADLNKTPELKRVPFMAEDLPADFVQRPGEFDELIRLLLGETREDPVAITAALRGAGGYGKTTLAKALCHDERIQDAFDDGVLWVTLGETPGDLTGRVEDLIYTLSGHRPGFTGVDAATARLVELLADRDLLLVIDDVWNSAHLRPFTQGGPRCARLITTRNLDTLPGHAQKVKVDAMRQDEAVALLSAGLIHQDDGDNVRSTGFSQKDSAAAPLPPEGETTNAFRRLAKRLGEWPLLLRLVNSALRNRVENDNKPLPDALAWVNQALDKRGLTYFDARDSRASRQAVKQTIGISLDLLTESDRALYAELAIFPEDVEIPLPTLERLWGETGNLDEFDTEDLCTRLNRLSLLVSYDASNRRILLHDVVRSFLIGQQHDRLTELHNHLLDAHRPARWADMPDAEPYLWDYLAFHLIEAQRGDELVATVKDWRYLTKKTWLRKSLSVEKDLLQAEQFASADDPLQTLRRSFANSGHLFNHCRTKEDVEATLLARLFHLNELKATMSDLAQNLPSPHLEPLHPLPDLPHPALLRTLEGHQASVLDCDFSPDGKLIVSASSDHTLKVWDVRTGELLITLEGHTAPVSGCAFSQDGKVIVSASWDSTLKIWKTKTGELLNTLSGHSNSVSDCAVGPDGSWILSASYDNSLKIWDFQTGELLRTLTGHSGCVSSCRVSPDGKLLISASSDSRLKVWDLETGKLLQVLGGGQTHPVKGCAFSPDGKYIVSTSSDQTIKVWDFETGRMLRRMEGHLASVSDCVFSPDGTLIISASDDRTLKVWDFQAGDLLTTLEGHSYGVSSCAFSPDGKQLVSASQDNTLKVWEMLSGERFRSLEGHSASVLDCTFSPDGKQIVSASYDRTLKVWDAQTGDILHNLVDRSWVVIRGTAFSPDGKQIALASDHFAFNVLNYKTGKVLHWMEGHSASVSSCVFRPDGKLVVSASSDHTLKVWDVQIGKLLTTLEGHSDSVSDCAFSPDGKWIVSASWDKTLKVWDSQTGELLHTLEGHRSVVRSCAFSFDGKQIVSASYDSTLKIWDAQTGILVRTLEGHSDSVLGCVFSPEGELIISVSDDYTMKIWDALTRKCLTTFYADGNLLCCAIQGETIVAGGARGVYFLKLVR